MAKLATDQHEPNADVISDSQDAGEAIGGEILQDLGADLQEPGDDASSQVGSVEQDPVSAQLLLEQHSASSRPSSARGTPSTSRPRPVLHAEDASAALLNSALTPRKANARNSSPKQLFTDEQIQATRQHLEKYRRQSDRDRNLDMSQNPGIASGKLRRPSFQGAEPSASNDDRTQKAVDPYEFPESPEKTPPSAQRPGHHEGEKPAEEERIPRRRATEDRQESPAQTNHVTDSPEPARPKRGPGRPRKDAAAPSITNQKRKRGRPSKEAEPSTTETPAAGPQHRIQPPDGIEGTPRARDSKRPKTSTASETRRSTRLSRGTEVVEITREQSSEPTPNGPVSTQSRNRGRPSKRSSGSLPIHTKSTVQEKANDAEENQPVATTQARTRRKDSRRNKPKESKEEHDDEELEDTAFLDEDAEGGDDALYGQRAKLRQIWNDARGVKKVREQRVKNDLELRTGTAKGLVRDCKVLARKLRDIATKPDVATSTEESDIREELFKIEACASSLGLDNVEDVRDFLFQDLYAYVFPNLLRVLCSAVDYYVDLFPREDNSVPENILKEVIIDFTSTMIKLGDAMRTNKTKVPSDLFIARPVQRYIVAPLRQFHTALVQEHRVQVNKEASTQARHKAEELRRRTAQHVARETAKKEAESARYEDWRRLHIDRVEVEPLPQLRHRLGWVPLEQLDEGRDAAEDIDANGDPFDRLDAFDYRREHPRDGRAASTGTVVQEVGQEWTDEQCLALMTSLIDEGKKEHRNPRYSVYKNIFLTHCRPGGVLRSYTVLDIVKKARYFKELMGDVDWTDKIPIF